MRASSARKDSVSSGLDRWQAISALSEGYPAELPRISVRDNWWIVIPIAALVAAIHSHVFWFLNYVHVFTAILWTGTDIFMGFILGPILRRVDLQTRRAVITRLMPRMLFYMPTVSTVTITAGWYMAAWLGFFQARPPGIYWLWAALAIVVVLSVQGLGVLLPLNLRVYFEIRKDRPNGMRIQRWMNMYVRVVASQAVLQFAIVFIMSRFTTGM